jgi:hypothetical protein
MRATAFARSPASTYSSARLLHQASCPRRRRPAGQKARPSYANRPASNAKLTIKNGGPKSRPLAPPVTVAFSPREVQLLREKLDAMRGDRDAWREQACKEGDERRELAQRLALAAPKPEARRPLWRRLLWRG